MLVSYERADNFVERALRPCWFFKAKMADDGFQIRARGFFQTGDRALILNSHDGLAIGLQNRFSKNIGGDIADGGAAVWPLRKNSTLVIVPS